MCAAQETVEGAEIAEIPAKLRKQRHRLEIQVAHEPGVVQEIGFQAPSNDPNGTKLDGLIILNREGSNALSTSSAPSTRFPFAAGTPRGSTTVRAAKESLAGWIAERDNEGDNTGDGAYLVEPRSFLMIGPCAIRAAPKATELARSSVALKVSARTASHRRCSPLTSLSSVHGGAWSLPRGKKRRKRNFLTSRSKERSCSPHIIDFCCVTGVGTRCNRGVATNPLQLVGEFTESSEQGFWFLSPFNSGNAARFNPAFKSGDFRRD